MVNLVTRKYVNCTRYAYYNYKYQVPKYCSDHKLTGMLSVRHCCLYENCKKYVYARKTLRFCDERMQYSNNCLLKNK